jgi:hypothetical protein
MGAQDIAAFGGGNRDRLISGQAGADAVLSIASRRQIVACLPTLAITRRAGAART